MIPKKLPFFLDSSLGSYIVLWFNVCNKELLALRNNFRATKKFLIAKFDCITKIHTDQKEFWHWIHNITLFFLGLKFIRKVGDSPSFKKFGAEFYDKPFPFCKDLTFESDEYWECYVRSMTNTGEYLKVHIFWEGHKILRNLHLTFDYSTDSQKLGSQNFVAFSEYMNFKKLGKAFKPAHA